MFKDEDRSSLLDILKGFYEKAAAFVQEGLAPPPHFKKYKRNENTGGVVRMPRRRTDISSRTPTHPSRP